MFHGVTLAKKSVYTFKRELLGNTTYNILTLSQSLWMIINVNDEKQSKIFNNCFPAVSHQQCMCAGLHDLSNLWYSLLS